MAVQHCKCTDLCTCGLCTLKWLTLLILCHVNFTAIKILKETYAVTLGICMILVT